MIKKNSALINVFGSMLLAIVVGLLAGTDKGIGNVTYVQIFDLVGQLFLNALTLVVVPLVVASIITGTARMGAEGSFGTLGVKTIFYFLLTTTLAVLTGYVVVMLMNPGDGFLVSGDLAYADAKIKALEQISQEGGFAKIAQIILKLIPVNILAAASQGQMIGLIPFCLIFGYYMMKIEAPLASVMLSFWKALFQIMMKITGLIMKALPVGVFALVAKVVALSGIDSILSLAWFSATVISALCVYIFIVLSLLLKGIGGIDPVKHFKAMFPALLTGFSTSSSAAALPAAIECVEQRAGISNRICSFVLPLGVSVNLSAAALFQCIVPFFIAQAYGIELPLTTQLIIIVMSILNTIGMPGIPSASLIGIVITLKTVGLPTEGIALVLAVERILDMFRAATNVYGISCCAALVAKSEEEKNLYPVEQLQNANLGQVSQ
ncbi:MAG: dicarboxylate/amino acid:cation symporter [Parachlamydiaceae bacterium]|nr:dicarboxylate/amino acid:cation symporter [Parachlamydiaceae bacterium]